MTEDRERQARLQQRYEEALGAHGELMGFIRGYRAAMGDDPGAEAWLTFVDKQLSKMLTAVFLLGEELENGGDDQD